MALAAQSLIYGIRADRNGARMAATRAENALPGDPEVLAATRGHGRVAASLFADDIQQALRDSSAGIWHAEQAPPQSPGLAWAFHALLQAVAGVEGRRALERARAAGAAVGWSQAWLAYAEAVLDGRAGNASHAAALADEGDERFRPYAPWWNHLVRRLVVEDAIKDGWGRAREGAGPRPIAAAGRDEQGDGCVRAGGAGAVQHGHRGTALYLGQDRGDSHREPGREDRPGRPARPSRQRRPTGVVLSCRAAHSISSRCRSAPRSRVLAATAVRAAGNGGRSRPPPRHNSRPSPRSRQPLTSP